MAGAAPAAPAPAPYNSRRRPRSGISPRPDGVAQVSGVRSGDVVHALMLLHRRCGGVRYRWQVGGGRRQRVPGIPKFKFIIPNDPWFPLTQRGTAMTELA